MEKLILRRVQPLLRKEKTSITRNSNDLVIDKKSFQRDPVETENLYRSLITEHYSSLPIPTQKCVPIMASREQVYFYEAQFVVPAPNYPKYQTIKDLLSIYSYSSVAPVGKLEFVLNFFNNIRSMNINLDVAIVCADAKSQHFLYQALLQKEFNIQIISLIVPDSGMYGVIIKIRKQGKKNTPISRMEVDIIMVYDSAINYPETHLSQFKGAYHHSPHVLYLTTMDTADIRCYISEVHDKNNWNDCYDKVKNQQQVFHQINRHPSFEHFKLWNQYISNQVAEWAKKKTTEPYHYSHPNKQASRAKEIWLSFPNHHKSLRTIPESKSSLITKVPTIKAAFPAFKGISNNSSNSNNNSNINSSSSSSSNNQPTVITNSSDRNSISTSTVNCSTFSPVPSTTKNYVALPTPVEKDINHNITPEPVKGTKPLEPNAIPVLPESNSSSSVPVSNTTSDEGSAMALSKKRPSNSNEDSQTSNQDTSLNDLPSKRARLDDQVSQKVKHNNDPSHICILYLSIYIFFFFPYHL
ncbi:uncharacterized protein BX663DRAFT_521595 [Cokeromyces recurvatus]|uniref:uncharacterized protein n=1 Tax=Cokeromyces recurvatus TaxID=90255 RepID=UPI0022205375|nr:uncharacterized protein BX663DRAFT_521595 [Cokeromyces recurvatus]KAI7899392.1 hypothetical protein BX663DRAFT_521595 [Cokeromyces recurvatus]